MGISDISVEAAASAAPQNHMGDLFRSIGENLQEYDSYIRDGFTEGLGKDSKLLGIPPHIQDQFKVWEETFTDPADIAFVKEAKHQMMSAIQSTEGYVKEKAENEFKKFKTEIMMKFVSKTTGSIQSLLNAQ